MIFGQQAKFTCFVRRIVLGRVFCEAQPTSLAKTHEAGATRNSKVVVWPDHDDEPHTNTTDHHNTPHKNELLCLSSMRTSQQRVWSFVYFPHDHCCSSLESNAVMAKELKSSDNNWTQTHSHVHFTKCRRLWLRFWWFVKKTYFNYLWFQNLDIRSRLQVEMLTWKLHGNLIGKFPLCNVQFNASISSIEKSNRAENCLAK